MKLPNRCNAAGTIVAIDTSATTGRFGNDNVTRLVSRIVGSREPNEPSACTFSPRATDTESRGEFLASFFPEPNYASASHLMRLNILPAVVMFAVSFASAAYGPQASGQGIQDLFKRPEPQQERLADDSVEAMFDRSARDRSAATDGSARVTSPSDRRLTEDNGSVAELRQSAAMQIRQARALEAYRQRQARLEFANWSGQPTLRPNWSGLSAAGLRFSTDQVLYVPLYLHR